MALLRGVMVEIRKECEGIVRQAVRELYGVDLSGRK